MPTCRICLHTFNSLKFQTKHIDICTRCVNTLNRCPEPARNAEARFSEKLARGMQRNAERDLKSDDELKRRKAAWTLTNLDVAVDSKLHDWITKLLAKPINSTRDFKIMRAHRRGLLRMEGLSNYEDRNWQEVARRIRHRDGFKCMMCGETNTTLDVHHIVYLSHHGTNQQNNLITLCRQCHEFEHDRIFDWPESQDPESVSPIQPLHNAQTLSSEPTQVAWPSELLFEPVTVSVGRSKSDSAPELMVPSFELAVFHIEAGARKFTDYAKAMVADLGEVVVPYLGSAYEGARSWPDLNPEGMTSTKESNRLHAEMITPEHLNSETVGEAADKPVSTKESGPVVSGDASLTMGTPNGGFDPEMLVNGATIAGAYIESGVRSFTQYAKAMVDDMGDSVKPYLLLLWEGLRNYPGLDTKEMTSTEDSAREFAALSQESSVEHINNSDTYRDVGNDTNPMYHDSKNKMRDIRRLSKSRITHELAEALSRKLTCTCIRDLQRMNEGVLLSDEFSGLRNVWDEICVQQQNEPSFFWDAYLDIINTLITFRIENLRPYELDALCLLTCHGDDWMDENEDQREIYPVTRDHVVSYVLDEVLIQALNWRNDRISRYLERNY